MRLSQVFSNQVFSNFAVNKHYQYPTDLFRNLKDGNVNTKEVLKNQIDFKLDLDEIKEIQNQNQKIK